MLNRPINGRRAGRPIVFLDPYNGGLSAARTLRRRGERVVVVAGPANAHTALARGVDGRVVEFEPAGEPWLRALESLGQRRAQAVLTGGDVASAWLVAARDKLPPALLTFEAQDDAHLKLMSKIDADAIARAAGVTVPWTVPVSSESDLDAAIGDAPWPCVLKPALSHAWRSIFGDNRVLLVRNERDARREAERAFGAGLPMIMSEYVPGSDGNVEEAILVRTPDGTYPVHFGCKKIRQYPVGFGAASLCEIADLPESMAIARAVLDAAGFVGVAGVETKRHAETGRHYFLEVNVRIPTQWGLGDAAGLDASRRLAATIRGERLNPQPAARRRARLVFPEQEFRAVLAAVRGAPGAERRVVVGDLIRSYAGTRDLGILDPRDPMPGVGLMSAALNRRLAASFRRRRVVRTKS